MKHFHLTFGIKEPIAQTMRAELESEFGLRFEAHDSSYLGGYYLLAVNGPNEEIRIQWNDDDGEPAELEFPDLDILVLIDGTPNPQKWKECRALKGAVFIRELEYDVP